MRRALYLIAALFGQAWPALGAEIIEDDFRGLRLGLGAEEMPVLENQAFACGSNGGPPLKPLKGWRDYKSCPSDRLGLHEVYVEFDVEGRKEAELAREIIGQQLWIDKFAGTKIAGFPVILSALFDAGGTVKALRAVTDSRIPVEDRARAHALRLRIKARYHQANWDCAMLPLSGGETPVGRSYIKERCTGLYAGDRRLVLEGRFYRRLGQTGFDRAGNPVDGEFEASTRWEVWALDVPIE